MPLVNHPLISRQETRPRASSAHVGCSAQRRPSPHTRPLAQDDRVNQADAVSPQLTPHELHQRRQNHSVSVFSIHKVTAGTKADAKVDSICSSWPRQPRQSTSQSSHDQDVIHRSSLVAIAQRCLSDQGDRRCHHCLAVVARLQARQYCSECLQLSTLPRDELAVARAGFVAIMILTHNSPRFIQPAIPPCPSPSSARGSLLFASFATRLGSSETVSARPKMA